MSTYKYQVGQWVRFMYNGRLVLGVVSYIAKESYYPHKTRYWTDAGIVTEDEILEAR